MELSEKVTTIGKQAFYGSGWSKEQDYIVTGNGILCAVSSKLEGEFVVPDGVKSIAEGAFMYCSKLTSVVVPEGVVSIGDSAFDYCEKVKTLTLPDSITLIGNINGWLSKFRPKTVIAPKGSFAEQWAKDKGYEVSNE